MNLPKIDLTKIDPTKEKALENLIKERDDKYYEHLKRTQEALDECEDLKSICDSRIANINAERSLLRREINELYNFLIKFGDMGEKITIFEYVFEDFVNIPHFNTIQKKSKNTRVQQAGFLDYYFYGVGAIVKHFQNRKALIDAKADFEKEYTEWEKELSELKLYKDFLEKACKIAEVYFKLIIIVKDVIYYTIVPELEGIQSFLYAQSAKDIILCNETIKVLSPSKISRFKGSKKYNRHYTFIKNTHDYYCLITEFFKTPVFTNFVTTFENKGILQENDTKEFNDSVKQIEDLNDKLLNNTVFTKKLGISIKKKSKK